MAEYRDYLIDAGLKSQEAYDKAVLTLAAGSLGFSMTFREKVAAPKVPVHTESLAWAWTFWAIALSVMLFSFYFSTLAIRKGVAQHDAGMAFVRPFGGLWSGITTVLNPTAGVAYVVGVYFFAEFAAANISRVGK